MVQFRYEILSEPYFWAGIGIRTCLGFKHNTVFRIKNVSPILYYFIVHDADATQSDPKRRWERERCSANAPITRRCNQYANDKCNDDTNKHFGCKIEQLWLKIMTLIEWAAKKRSDNNFHRDLWLFSHVKMWETRSEKNTFSLESRAVGGKTRLKRERFFYSGHPCFWAVRKIILSLLHFCTGLKFKRKKNNFSATFLVVVTKTLCWQKKHNTLQTSALYQEWKLRVSTFYSKTQPMTGCVEVRFLNRLLAKLFSQVL